MVSQDSGSWQAGTAKPLSHLYSLSLRESIVPTQWMSACIISVHIPNIPAATQCYDFRPISRGPVLSRVLVNLITRHGRYPMIDSPTVAPTLNYQYAYRPTGSTSAALIAIHHDLAHLLNSHPYVHIGLDFSKAFDTVRHSTLIGKLASNREGQSIVIVFVPMTMFIIGLPTTCAIVLIVLG